MAASSCWSLWVMLRHVGGSSSDSLSSLALDGSNNPTYVGGFTGRLTVGSDSLSSSGYSDVLLVSDTVSEKERGQ